ncbi:MAG: BamA/TamA family outer membrane protein [Bacteroidales bacterium]|nr:BamA/TamA family outer membrane protein [Bacteroidales bacterium]
MKLFLSLFFIYLASQILIGNKSYAQKEYKLEIKASLNSEQSIIDNIKYRTNYISDSYRTKAVQEVIMKLQAQSYVLASIDSSTISEKNEIFYISLNSKYQWERLGKGNLSTLAISDIGFQENHFQDSDFNYAHLLQIEETVIRYYENHGYPFASITLDSIKVNKQAISAVFKLEKGPQIYIDTIMLNGFNDIHHNYIYQLLDIKPGDLYNEEKIGRIKNKLASMPFAYEKKAFYVAFEKQKASINLNLAKRKTNIFDGIVGLQPKSSIDNKMMLTGNLKLKLFNSFKRGEMISLNWKSPGSGSQNLDIGFAYPYLFNSPIGVDYTFKLFKQDTNFINLSNKPGVRFIINGTDYIKISADLFSSTMLSNELVNGIPTNNDMLDIRSNMGNLEANISRFDYLFNPRKGWRINISAGYGSKNIIRQHDIKDEFYDSIPMASQQVKLKAHLEYFIPIFRRQTLRIWSMSEMLQGDNLFTNELFRIGGFSDFRGFNEESIYASTYSILTLEWRLLLERNSFISVFWNKAYVENSAGAQTTYDQPMGFGAGLSFETKAGIFAISYALGQQLGNPIEFSQAKIHFGYMALF